MVFAGLNYLAVVVAALGAFAFGSAYYGVLGKSWTAALGTTETGLKGPDGKMSPFPFILTFVAELSWPGRSPAFSAISGPVR